MNAAQSSPVEPSDVQLDVGYLDEIEGTCGPLYLLVMLVRWVASRWRQQ